MIKTMYKIDIRVTLKDPFGSSLSETATFYSHRLKTGTKPEAQKQIYQAITGKVPLDAPFSKGSDKRYRKDRILDNMLYWHGSDGIFTINEMEILKAVNAH